MVPETIKMAQSLRSEGNLELAGLLLLAVLTAGTQRLTDQLPTKIAPNHRLACPNGFCDQCLLGSRVNLPCRSRGE